MPKCHFTVQDIVVFSFVVFSGLQQMGLKFSVRDRRKRFLYTGLWLSDMILPKKLALYTYQS